MTFLQLLTQLKFLKIFFISLQFSKIEEIISDVSKTSDILHIIKFQVIVNSMLFTILEIE